jgi:hypothetical protein
MVVVGLVVEATAFTLLANIYFYSQNPGMATLLS